MPKTALLGMLTLIALPTASALAAGVEVTRGSGQVAASGVTVLRGEPSMPKGSGWAEPTLHRRRPPSAATRSGSWTAIGWWPAAW